MTGQLTIPVNNEDPFQFMFLHRHSGNDSRMVEVAVPVGLIVHCVVTGRSNDSETMFDLAVHYVVNQLNRTTSCESAGFVGARMKIDAIVSRRQTHELAVGHRLRIFKLFDHSRRMAELNLLVSTWSALYLHAFAGQPIKLAAFIGLAYPLGLLRVLGIPLAMKLEHQGIIQKASPGQIQRNTHEQAQKL